MQRGFSSKDSNPHSARISGSITFNFGRIRDFDSEPKRAGSNTATDIFADSPVESSTGSSCPTGWAQSGYDGRGKVLSFSIIISFRL